MPTQSEKDTRASGSLKTGSPARFFYSSPELMCVIGSDGRIRRINPAWQALMGYSERDLTGRLFLEIIHEDDRERARSWFQLKNSSDGRLELRCLPRNGAYRWLSFSTFFAGEENAHYAVAHDVSHHKRLEQELENQGRAGTLKSDFIGAISHELRTPLTIVQGSIDNFRDGLAGRTTKVQREIIGLAHRNIHRLARLLNNLLDLSKLESGRVRMRRHTFDLARLTGDALARVRTAADEKNISIKTDFPPEPLDVRADPDLIARVIENVVDNAVRFAKARIDLKIEKRAGFTEICVADDGEGISPDQAQELFDKHVQAARPSANGRNSVGLGLAIAKEIITLHSGRIWAVGRAPNGTEIHFTIPETLHDWK